MGRPKLDKKYAEMYEKYNEGLSLTEVGKLYGMTRRGVFTGFKNRKYILRPRSLLDKLMRGKKSE